MTTLSLNTNLMAMNAGRNLTAHYAGMANSVRGLSSGLRVSTAADDAAGLAIRELMRADIAALNQGIRNANDAISLIQTADGALGIIDEKLIRMKELAEQAATGTYNSDQRLMINSEFQAMASEIQRIAVSTDFNGVKLLDGSLSGPHDGSGLTPTGELKVHFGTGNDSAEDYYYINIGDATLAGLGLANNLDSSDASSSGNNVTVTLNDWVNNQRLNMPTDGSLADIGDTLLSNQGTWYSGLQNGKACNNFMFLIPKGTKNFVFNSLGLDSLNVMGDNDIALFTKNGVHLAGTPLDDFAYDSSKFDNLGNIETSIAANSAMLGFTEADYDGSQLNSGPSSYDPTGNTLKYTTYNGMTIGYSGDPDRHDGIPNNGKFETWRDYEVLTIDEVKEDLILWLPGQASALFKAYGTAAVPSGSAASSGAGEAASIETQEQAQRMLARIDNAIIKKDKIRAHLGALQNRFENTASNLRIQAENMQAAESRISDADVSLEMTEFVRSQILTQAATAMLAQANSLPKMLAGLLEG